jgi:hypothetical protein
VTGETARQDPAMVGGPWFLVRELDGERVTLDNSFRSTLREVERLRDEERRRTGIRWEILAD